MSVGEGLAWAAAVVACIAAFSWMVAFAVLLYRPQLVGRRTWEGEL